MPLTSYLKVSRPPLLILGVLASFGLLSWAGYLQTEFLRSALVIVTVGCANWGWTLWNEYHDLDVDKVNKPWKPLPSGEVSKRNVFTLGCLLFYVSLIGDVALTVLFGAVYLIGFLGHLSALIYNVVRKDLFGNFCMAITYGIGAFLSLYPHHLIFCLPFALFTMAHNINNQYQDVEAEKTAGIVTVPQQLGVWKTYWLTQILLLISLNLFFHLYLITTYKPLLIFLTVTVTTIISTCSMLLKNEKKAQWIIENVARRLGRFLLLIGFLTMLVIR